MAVTAEATKGAHQSPLKKKNRSLMGCVCVCVGLLTLIIRRYLAVFGPVFSFMIPQMAITNPVSSITRRMYHPDEKKRLSG